MLKFPPFAASKAMEAAARNQPPLGLHMKSTAVKLLQSGLIQQKIALPQSLKNGVPDGVYGQETFDGVKTFQRNNKFMVVDGTAGHDTIVLLDALLANDSPPAPAPVPVPPSSPVDRNYEIGTKDPPLAHDPGAGVWASSPKQATYIALRLAIIDVLPQATLIIGPDAVRHMAHYLSSKGTDLTINLEGMVTDVPSAKARFQREVAQMQRFVETLPAGSRNAITSKNVEVGYNRQAENTNWFFAIGGYSTWGKGVATVSGTPANPTFDVDFEYKFYDRYNWDAGKSITFHGITVTDRFMGEFHRQGLAKEYNCFGSFNRHFSWNKGQAIPPAQYNAPGGR